jgi:signal transduction histidine kinase
MNRLYDAKGIDVTVFGGEAAVFRGEQQDLEEMVGNLMENACKWAKADVRVSVLDDATELRIEVDDDGPGLTAEEREGALKRGVRLDETTPAPDWVCRLSQSWQSCIRACLNWMRPRPGACAHA